MKQLWTKLIQALKDLVSGPLKRLQDFAVTTFLHRILIPTFLFITYFLAFGIASLFLRVFARKVFRPAYIDDSTFWVRSEGNEADLERAKHQS